MLNSQQRSKLRSLAHPLKPVVFIGKNGLSESVIESIEESLNAHELIKIKFLEYKDEKKELCQEINEKCSCEQVGLVGHIATFYRAKAEPDKASIKL